LLDLTFPSMLSALGALVGIAGTILNISTKLRLKLVVFVLWTISDIALLLWAVFTAQLWLGTMYTVYLFVALMGLTNTLRVLRKQRINITSPKYKPDGHA